MADTTGMGEKQSAVDDSVLVGAEGRATAVGRAGLGETVGVSAETREIAVDPGDILNFSASGTMTAQSTMREEGSQQARRFPASTADEAGAKLFADVKRNRKPMMQRQSRMMQRHGMFRFL